MNEDLIVELGTNALKTTALISAPLLIAALVVGILANCLSSDHSDQ